jgi:hypothetical protein
MEWMERVETGWDRMSRYWAEYHVACHVSVTHCIQTHMYNEHKLIAKRYKYHQYHDTTSLNTGFQAELNKIISRTHLLPLMYQFLSSNQVGKGDKAVHLFCEDVKGSGLEVHLSFSDTAQRYGLAPSDPGFRAVRSSQYLPTFLIPVVKYRTEV